MRSFEDLVRFWKKLKSKDVLEITEAKLRLEIAKEFGISDYTIKSILKNLIDFGMFNLVVDNKEKKIRVYRIVSEADFL